VLNQYGLDLKAAGIDTASMGHDELAATLLEKVQARYEEKEALFSAATLRWLERHILLDIVDAQWKDHLLTLDHLKEGIGLRGYGQKDPLVEFKKEAFTLFDELMNRIDTEAVRFLFLMQPAKPEDEAKQIEQRQRRQQQNLQFQAGPAQAEAPKPVRSGAKVGRNDPCPCGSGKKYKKCHGAAA
jgi:preprotein translocase subunit SecA